MPLDVAGQFERLMNAGNDKGFSWWPLVHCRPVRTERFGVKAMAASGVVSMTWIVLAIAALPFVLAVAFQLAARHPLLITLALYKTCFDWSVQQGLMDAILAATAIGWPLSIAWSTWAWNRRARRLSMGDELSTSTTGDVDGVWPPPPTT